MWGCLPSFFFFHKRLLSQALIVWVCLGRADGVDRGSIPPPPLPLLHRILNGFTTAGLVYCDEPLADVYLCRHLPPVLTR